MRRRRDPSLTALLAGFLVLVAAIGATIWLSFRQQEAFASVSHTLRVQNQLSLVMTRLQDAETGERGFLLTRRELFLIPYRDALANYERDITDLRALVVDNPRQIAAVDRLAVVARDREALLSSAINRFREGRTMPPEHFLRGRAMMNEIRRSVTALKGEEERLLRLRTAEAERYTVSVTTLLVVTGLLVIALGIFAFGNSRRQLGAAIASRNALADANARLTAEAESRMAAETQVRQMQKVEALGQLTGGIAHDFNNMLAVIVGSLDLVQQRLESGDTRKIGRNVSNALEGAQRAAQLTARLLAFSRQQPLAPQSVDVNKLVGGMSELLRRTIGEPVRVETVLAGGLWRTFADPGQIENSIVNLCVNARDAMPDGGKVTIETSNAHLDDDYAALHADVSPGQYVMISLTDTGVGMPQEVAERAFDPFYTTKGPGKGTGLGLSQVFGFVKQSRGHVKIYSEPGHGTTVKVYLPRFTGAQEEERMAVAEGIGDLPRAQGEIILVVEDDERVRHVSVDSLRELGYTVVQAADAVQALAVLTLQPRIDLLFTDVVMPEMNGRQLAEKARETRPELKVLYTTGYTRNAIVHNGMLDPDVAFLAKPFTIDQLARKVRQVLDAE